MEIRTIFGDLVDALTYIHGLGIVHLDVKPENILIRSATEKTTVFVLADFSLATELNLITEHTLIEGDKIYQAPEVFNNASRP